MFESFCIRWQKYCRFNSSFTRKTDKYECKYFPIAFDDEFSEEIKERLKKPPTFFENDVNYTKFRNFDEEKSDKKILYDDICFHLALFD